MRVTPYEATRHRPFGPWLFCGVVGGFALGFVLDGLTTYSRPGTVGSFDGSLLGGVVWGVVLALVARRYVCFQATS